MQLNPPMEQQPGVEQFSDWLLALQPAVHRLAARLAGNQADAADLAQATTLRALEKRALFVRGSAAELRRWLCKIMMHLHFDALRKGAREVAVGWLEDVAATVEPPPPAWAMISDEEVTTAVERLRQPLRETYRLYAVDRVPYAIISSRLRIPLSTVATRILRARTRLRQALSAGESRNVA